MNIFILAAGKGTRLGVHNKNKPKCLFKIDNISLIERNLIIFRKARLNPILITGYEKEKLDFLNLKSVYNPEYSETNMLWSLYKAISYMNEGFLICYGDILVNLNLVIKLINLKNGIGCVVDEDWLSYWKLRFKNPLDDAESLVINKLGYIKNIGNKVKNIQEIQAQYIGFLKVSGNYVNIFKEYLQTYCERKKTKDIAKKAYITDFLQYLINQNVRIKAVRTNGGWIEIDTFSDLLAAKISGRLQKIDYLKKKSVI